MGLKTILVLLLLVVFAATLVSAQAKKPLTNGDIIQMVKAGFTEQTITDAIKANDSAFDASVQGLMALKNAGVSQNIIDAMLLAEARKKAAAPVANSAKMPTLAAHAYLEKGNRFLTDKEYSEALEQYKDGLQAQPNNPTLLGGKAVAEAGVNDFSDAEADGEKAIAAGGSLAFPIAHNHWVGYCTGTLVLQRGKISFQPTSGDHGFTVTSSSQIGLAEGSYSGMPDLVVPDLVVHWQGPDGKDHKYDMFLMSFVSPGGQGFGHMFVNQFHFEGDAEQQTIRLGQMIESLAKVSLPSR